MAAALPLPLLAASWPDMLAMTPDLAEEASRRCEAVEGLFLSAVQSPRGGGGARVAAECPSRGDPEASAVVLFK